jgi:hypothetical protein
MRIDTENPAPPQILARTACRGEMTTLLPRRYVVRAQRPTTCGTLTENEGEGVIVPYLRGAKER